MLSKSLHNLDSQFLVLNHIPLHLEIPPRNISKFLDAPLITKILQARNYILYDYSPELHKHEVEVLYPFEVSGYHI